MLTRIKTNSEIVAMREGGQMLALVLARLTNDLKPGATTKHLSDIAEREIKALGGQPAFLGYYGFPEVLCVSINDEVVHGIPTSQRQVNDGDIVSLDFGVKHKGLITDGAISIVAGQGSKRDLELVETTKLAMYAGVAAAKIGGYVGDISAAVQAVLDVKKYGIVRDLVGHGVGHELHEEPNIPNYGRAGMGMRLVEGMTIAIEPMATLGDFRVYIDSDGWTVKTRDGSRSAHFENTVLVTAAGGEILTELPK